MKVRIRAYINGYRFKYLESFSFNPATETQEDLERQVWYVEGLGAGIYYFKINGVQYTAYSAKGIYRILNERLVA